MLDNEARTDLQTIKDYLFQIFGENCELSEPEIKNSPYPEFKLTMLLYRKVQAAIAYDRSALDIGIKQNGKYVLLQKFTQEEVERGLEATKPPYFYNNFCILDRVAKRLAGIN